MRGFVESVSRLLFQAYSLSAHDPLWGEARMHSLRVAASFILVFLAGVAQAGTEDEVKALFAKFVAAQNAHDLKAVSETLQDSPQFLWITRGTPVWGRDEALKRFAALY